MHRPQLAAAARFLLPAFGLCLLIPDFGCAQNEEKTHPSSPARSARTVAIQADGTIHTVRSPKGTVADALQAAGIELGAQDECSPAAATPIHPGMTIRVCRITTDIIKRSEPIRARTRVVATRSLRAGLTMIKQHPEDRLKELVEKVILRDGAVAARALISARVLRPAQDKIIHVGGALARLPSRGGYFTGRRVLTMVASGYDPSPRSCGPSASGRTYTGQRAQRGVVAVDPRVIPLGARLYVEGYGEAVASDIGGAIKGNRIDLCFDSYREADDYGLKKVKVWILSD